MAELIASSEFIAVVGMGDTGLSVARFLHSRQQKFIMLDTRTAPPNFDKFTSLFAGVPVELGPLTSETLSRASKIVLSPGVDRNEPAIKKALELQIPVLGDIQLFVDAVQSPIVAITGSNGKSTVTTLVGEMLAQAGKNVAVAGNIGTPVLDLLTEGETERFEIVVLELSSFQLESTPMLNADAAVILNVSADHMDRYANLQQYHRAKQRIFFGAKKVVVNRQDPLSQPPVRGDMAVISFGLDKPDLKQFGLIRENSDTYLALGLEKLLNCNELKIRGSHNMANALAALAIGHALSLPMANMLQTVKSFSGLAHRCQWVGEINGIEFVNDSKGTNVGATLAAINGLGEEHKKLVLIAGGEGKDADFTPLRKAFQQRLRYLIAVGRDAELLAELADDVGIPFAIATSMTESVAAALRVANPGDVVLLSPACASFDMFKDYVDRGEQFCQAVQELQS